MATPRDNRRGIVALMICMAAFSANDTIVKLTTRTLPAGEVVFVRGVFTAILLGAAMVLLGYHRRFREALIAPVWGRAVTDGLASGLFVVALAHMRIADISAVLMTVPLILTASGVLLFGEQVGWRRWTAIFVGFAGVVLIVKPTPTEFDAWALLALASAFAAAGRDLYSRRIGSAVPAVTVSFVGAIAVTLTGLCLAPGEAWRMPSAIELGWLLLAAAFLGIGAYYLTRAFRGVDVSVVAPFRYTLLLFALTAGYLVFDELPDAWAATGALLIAGSGLYVMRRDAIRRRDAETLAVERA